MKPLIIAFSIVLLVGCAQRKRTHEPTFGFAAVGVVLNGVEHQICYRVEEENGVKNMSPVVVFPRTPETKHWAISLNHDTEEFFVGRSGKNVMPQDCPIVYLAPGSDYVCLGEDLREELLELKSKEETVGYNVYDLVELYLNPEAEQGGSVKPDKLALP